MIVIYDEVIKLVITVQHLWVYTRAFGCVLKYFFVYRPRRGGCRFRFGAYIYKMQS